MGKFEHKTLGRFIQKDYFGDLRWECNVELPAFAVFKYCGNGRMRRSNKVPVCIYSDAEPPMCAIRVLQKIRRSQKALVHNILQAFYDDFWLHRSDDDPAPDRDSGMWWGNDPVEVALSCREALEKRLDTDRIYKPEDLIAVLYAPSIDVFPASSDDSSTPRTLVDLGAEFEVEHGVSALTDGKDILGLGYSGEAQPYETRGQIR